MEFTVNRESLRGFCSAGKFFIKEEQLDKKTSHKHRGCPVKKSIF